ncbi:hypothetical protein HCJ76_18575 [Streptomyces sp. MC1]|uniref:hypothetical protein n=1 Tax=unclassified Streptomyces TaxID=2593676 RepID=UPI0004C5CA1E|nr:MULTISPECIES: hypothetical protein [unclassified Streptomyces]MBG7700033.1 hypothetical protein [Streptomyces sp. MC1]
MPEQLRKWSLTSGTVVKHMHYGLRVQVPSGEIGLVDRVDIAEGYLDPTEWPASAPWSPLSVLDTQVVSFG